MARKINFFAGPSVLPVEVLEELGKEMVDFKGSGLSLVETSHRSATYDEVHMGALNLFRELLQVPDNYKILFLQGGATLQFSMIPLNLMGQGGTCDFVNSGAWAKKALADAKKIGNVNVVWDGKDSSYMTLPEAASVKPSAGSSYLHLTSNETIGGVQWKEFPKTGDVPLVADMSSDILCRPLNVNDFGLIYAGAQKNIGPSGLTVVIVRDDLIERHADELTAYMAYKTHAEKDSLYNTPGVFPIWAMELVLKRMKSLGGLDAFEKMNQEKADLLYNVISQYSDFYNCPVDEKYRSVMNVVFTTPGEETDKAFVAQAAEKGMLGLKGHRSVGGCRASIYNSMTKEGVETLASFMEDFAKANS
ncbi:MAG: 3-phosphoserine/phosphohydroxythreonine transaminase [Spirochaetales bacterium]|nr:3-phosphoserine/phosphohydroxythreonine transaminase [Spirochaetales bacterium]